MPLVNAELSVLVDVLHQPELLFLEGSDARNRCETGGFISKWDISLSTCCSKFFNSMFYVVLHEWIYLLCLSSRLIQHTKSLMNSDENLCLEVLKTLQEMLIRSLDFDEKVVCLGFFESKDIIFYNL